MFRRGLMALLDQHADFQIVGQAADGGEALRMLREQPVDLILLDNQLPGVSGVELIADLRACAPDSLIVMLTVSDDQEDLAAALHAGAQAYLLKTMDGPDLVAAIRQIGQGEAIVSPEMMPKLLIAFRAERAAAEGQATPFKLLTPREEQVLAELTEGASNKQIARRLQIAETTVKVHVQHILHKLEVGSRVEAAVYAARRDRFRD